MKMELGTEGKRMIILKYRQKLKAGLAQHEVKSDHVTHMMLLAELVRIVDEHNHEEWLKE